MIWTWRSARWFFFYAFTTILVAIFLFWEASDNQKHTSNFIPPGELRAHYNDEKKTAATHYTGFVSMVWMKHIYERKHVIPQTFLRKFTQHSWRHHTPQKAFRLCSTRTFPTRVLRVCKCVRSCVRMLRALTRSSNHGNRVMITPCPPIPISLAFISSSWSESWWCIHCFLCRNSPWPPLRLSFPVSVKYGIIFLSFWELGKKKTKKKLFDLDIDSLKFQDRSFILCLFSVAEWFVFAHLEFPVLYNFILMNYIDNNTMLLIFFLINLFIM